MCTNHHLGYSMVQVCYDQMIGLARNSLENLSPKLWFCLTKAMVSRKILWRISIESYGFLISPLRVALNEAAARRRRGYGSQATRLRVVLMFATISYTKKIGSKGVRVL